MKEFANQILRCGTVLLILMVSGVSSRAADSLPLIGYTEGRDDIPDGQFANWKTNRACVVRTDGTGRKVLAEALTTKDLPTRHRFPDFLEGLLDRAHAASGKCIDELGATQARNLRSLALGDHAEGVPTDRGP